MSAAGLQWIALILFLLLFVAVIFAEVGWLVKNAGTTTGKASAFVLISDFFGFGLGSFFLLMIALAGLMITFGPSGRGSDAPEAAYVAVVVGALVVPPITLFFTKRIMLALLKIKSGRSAWIYSIVSTLSILLFVLVPPTLFFLGVGYATSWK